MVNTISWGYLELNFSKIRGVQLLLVYGSQLSQYFYFSQLVQCWHKHLKWKTGIVFSPKLAAFCAPKVAHLTTWQLRKLNGKFSARNTYYWFLENYWSLYGRFLCQFPSTVWNNWWMLHPIWNDMQILMLWREIPLRTTWHRHFEMFQKFGMHYNQGELSIFTSQKIIVTIFLCYMYLCLHCRTTSSETARWASILRTLSLQVFPFNSSSCKVEIISSELEVPPCLQGSTKTLPSKHSLVVQSSTAVVAFGF